MIGFTERGDAGLDFAWTKETNVDGMVLITKNINKRFIEEVLNKFKSMPVIVHCTCTGMGGSVIEPNVPNFEDQLNNLKLLIDSGFPKLNTVLRIDPVIPEFRTYFIEKVLNKANELNLLPMRVRFSLMDAYPHVKERFKKLSKNIPYLNNKNFHASDKQMELLAKDMNDLARKFDLTMYTCAELRFAQFAKKEKDSRILEEGCISRQDLKIMNLEHLLTKNINGQNRFGCKCLAIKKELLKNKTRCTYKCVYCYWKD